MSTDAFEQLIDVAAPGGGSYPVQRGHRRGVRSPHTFDAARWPPSSLTSPYAPQGSTTAVLGGRRLVAVNQDGQLGAGADVEAAHHRGEVALDRCRAQEQPTGDLLVAETLGHERRHIALPLGEPVQGPTLHTDLGGITGEGAHELAGDGRVECGLLPGEYADGVNEPLRS